MLAIDDTKLQRLIEDKPANYSISASNLVVHFSPQFQLPSSAVYGADFSPAERTINREAYLSDLRNRVLASGISLKSPREIDSELAEMRRHAR
jgi:hypothetical protein